MAKFTKYYVVEKVTYRENGRTDRISFCPFDGIIEFATKEAVADVLKKRFDLYESKHWGLTSNGTATAFHITTIWAIVMTIKLCQSNLMAQL